MPEYQFSCNRFTVWVMVAEGRVVDAAPLVHRFAGQPVANLQRWCQKFGGLLIYPLPVQGSVPGDLSK